VRASGAVYQPTGAVANDAHRRLAQHRRRRRPLAAWGVQGTVVTTAPVAT
jgi:hypothetical protein